MSAGFNEHIPVGGEDWVSYGAQRIAGHLCPDCTAARLPAGGAK